MGQVSREYGFDVREPQRSDPMTPEEITSKLLYKLLKAGNQATAGVRKRAPALTTAQLRGHLPDMVLGTAHCDCRVMYPDLHRASDDEIDLRVTLTLFDDLTASIKPD